MARMINGEGKVIVLREIEGATSTEARVEGFLAGLHQRLAPGAPVFMADNVFMPGVGGELIRPEGSVDTYKLRRLTDGSTHRVLKNYYAADQLNAIFEPRASDLEITVGKCFWWLSYKVV